MEEPPLRPRRPTHILYTRYTVEDVIGKKKWSKSCVLKFRSRDYRDETREREYVLSGLCRARGVVFGFIGEEVIVACIGSSDNCVLIDEYADIWKAKVIEFTLERPE